MTVQIFPRVASSNVVVVMIRAQGPDGLVGDATSEIKRGASGFGYTYDELRAAAEPGGPDLFWPRTDGQPEVTPPT